MARIKQQIIKAFCVRNRIRVPAGFGRHATGRYVMIRTDCTPQKLIAKTWFNTTDLIYHVEHSLLPALGEALSRYVRILDFLDGAELAYRRGQFEVVAPFPARNPLRLGKRTGSKN